MLTVPQAAQQLRNGGMVLLSAGEGGLDDRAGFFLAGQFAREASIRQLQRVSGQAQLSVLVRQGTQTALYSALPEEDGLSLFVRAVQTLTHPPGRQEALQHLEALAGLAPAEVSQEQARYAEAALKLLQVAGLEPLVVFATLAPASPVFYQTWASLSVSTLEAYCREHRVSPITEINLPTAAATFRLRHYQEIATGLPYLALYLGDLRQQERPPLVRLHSECATGDIFGSRRCDCQDQLHAAMQTIAAEQCGLLLYLPQEGRGIGLTAKLQAYLIQEQGFDTIAANELLGYPADARDYTSTIEILQDFGLTRIRLLTNNPQKMYAISEGGIDVEHVSLEITPNASNEFYMRTKYERMGHLLSSFPLPES